jgi:hypothetical protein
LEKDEWNNGAFTKALVEGLYGYADLFNKKVITIKALDAYIATRVKELTKGQQSPTTIIPSSIPDFPIAYVLDDEHRERYERYTGEIDIFTGNYEVVKEKFFPFVVSVTLGINSFGTYARESVSGGYSSFAGAFDVARYFIPQFGAGVKACYWMNFAETSEFSGSQTFDRLLFYGPALYGKWGKKNRSFEFNAGAGIGGLTWLLSKDYDNDPSMAGYETHTTIGGYVSAGVSYFFQKKSSKKLGGKEPKLEELSYSNTQEPVRKTNKNQTGVGLNIQTPLGSLKDDDGYTRNPAGIGVSLSVINKF